MGLKFHPRKKAEMKSFCENVRGTKSAADQILGNGVDFYQVGAGERSHTTSAPRAFLSTYAALSELFGVDGRGEVESPRVVGRRVLPVDEALRRLAYSRACNGI